MVGCLVASVLFIVVVFPTGSTGTKVVRIINMLFFIKATRKGYHIGDLNLNSHCLGGDISFLHSRSVLFVEHVLRKSLKSFKDDFLTIHNI